jgi:hypothetical protein
MEPNSFQDKTKAWVVTVDMGYGHQRTANNLRHLAYEGIICANNYEGMPISDRKIWGSSRGFYEAISAFKKVPLLGNIAFTLFLDYFQRVQPFYPRRDLSKASLQVKQIYSLLKNGWGKDLIEKLKKNPLPLVSVFFTPAFMAEFFGYLGEIFCVVCDTDITRAWAPLDPAKSKIKYFAPTERVAERLKLYGVRPENIFLTGFPLPLDNTGKDLETLKQDLRARLFNLDPQKKFFKKYYPLIKERLGGLPLKSNHPLTLMFAVGGAGAQKELGVKILKSLAGKIKEGKIKMTFIAGIRKAVRDYFQKNIKALGLDDFYGKTPEVLCSESMEEYFSDFNASLRQADILWTKPSELSFYAGLGLPIIIAPTIGSHEEFNKRWLLKSNFGILQKDPRFTREWLFDLIDQGYLAERAFEGFLEGESRGTFNIQKIVEKCSGS